MRTPYDNHKELGHHMTSYSPNDHILIEECTECTARFMFYPGDKYPVTLWPHQQPKEERK